MMKDRRKTGMNEVLILDESVTGQWRNLENNGNLPHPQKTCIVIIIITPMFTTSSTLSLWKGVVKGENFARVSVD
jgi:hypothetical protein